MRIQSVQLHWVAIPFNEPFRIASGEVSEKEAIIVEITTTDGTKGYGESSPMGGSFYSNDTPDSAWNYLEKELIPFAFALADFSPESFAESLNQFKQEPFARAGIEGAVWDCHVRQTGIPLYNLLDGKLKTIPSGAAIGIYNTIPELLSRVEKYLHCGYTRIKIKIQPGWDVEPVLAIRRTFGNIPLMVDANASYSLNVHLPIFKELDLYGLMMYEQPLAKEAFSDAAILQHEIRTPICADESAYSVEALETIIAEESARIINIKIQRVGGLQNAKHIAERAMRSGLPCWLGTMPELGVASMQGLHLATHPAFVFPTDIEASNRWYEDDIIHPPTEIDSNGEITLHDWTIKKEKIEKYSRRHAFFSR